MNALSGTNATSQLKLPQGVDFDFVSTAAAIATEAGALLRDFYAQGVETEYKTEVDLVTIADRTSEKLILDRISAEFPTHGIFGEEGTRRQLDSEYRWYVDPLDGTTNFAHGFPAFCVSLGLEHRPAGTAEDADGVLVAGVIYDPLRDDLFVAEKGKGAYLNGKRLHASKVENLGQSLLATGFPSKARHKNPNVHIYYGITMRTHGVRRAGSAALDLAYTAAGRIDGYWEFNLNPWDTTAGVLLVLEAGGTVTGFDGTPFKLDSREVLATNGLLKDQLLGMFDDLFSGRELSPMLSPVEYAAQKAERAAKG